MGIIDQLIRELGLVCHDLREKAELHLKYDIGHYTRADVRTMKGFEAGTAGKRIADRLVDGYAEAFKMDPSEIGQIAMNRLREQAVAENRAAVEGAAQEIAGAARSVASGRGRKRASKPNRRATS